MCRVGVGWGESESSHQQHVVMDEKAEAGDWTGKEVCKSSGEVDPEMR